MRNIIKAHGEGWVPPFGDSFSEGAPRRGDSKGGNQGGGVRGTPFAPMAGPGGSCRWEPASLWATARAAVEGNCRESGRAYRNQDANLLAAWLPGEAGADGVLLNEMRQHSFPVGGGVLCAGFGDDVCITDHLRREHASAGG